MADQIDRACDIADLRLATILQNRGTAFKGESAKNCIECGEPIPEKRRSLLQGVKLCVECQQINEIRR